MKAGTKTEIRVVLDFDKKEFIQLLDLIGLGLDEMENMIDSKNETLAKWQTNYTNLKTMIDNYKFKTWEK